MIVPSSVWDHTILLAISSMLFGILMIYLYDDWNVIRVILFITAITTWYLISVVGARWMLSMDPSYQLPASNPSV